MSAPRYARLVRKLFAGEGASIAPPPPAATERARAIAAITEAIAARSRRRPPRT